jgi:hypothetical protein
MAFYGPTETPAYPRWGRRDALYSTKESLLMNDALEYRAKRMVGSARSMYEFWFATCFLTAFPNKLPEATLVWCTYPQAIGVRGIFTAFVRIVHAMPPLWAQLSCFPPTVQLLQQANAGRVSNLQIRVDAHLAGGTVLRMDCEAAAALPNTVPRKVWIEAGGKDADLTGGACWWWIDEAAAARWSR